MDLIERFKADFEKRTVIEMAPVAEVIGISKHTLHKVAHGETGDPGWKVLNAIHIYYTGRPISVEAPPKTKRAAA